ncbi:MAG: Ig-like domain-containing protein [Saprospiraceae bacterium]|nr:Ig-like domain-containing protein [Saprospiraceae bacterium]
MIAKNLLLTCSIISVIFLAGCKKDDFVEIDGVCPVVISTIPINGATDVPLDQIISVTFNEEMNPATINQASFTIQGGSAIQGTITYSGTKATFTPSVPLTANTTYTGKVKTMVKDKTGNALQTDYIWTFSTGVVLSPLVVSTDPANNEPEVTLNKIIMATFNMQMEATSINTATFFVSLEGNKIEGENSYTGTTASFIPKFDLNPNTTYTGTITTGVKNTDGTSLVADYIWTFTTGSSMAPMVISTDPTNNAVNVVLNKIVTTTFNEAMNISTITNGTFIVRQGANIIPGTVAYSSVTATFTPDASFTAGTIYTGTITTAAKNLTGVSITDNYVWTFTTAVSAQAPFVVSTDPANNSTEVSLDKTITATFNEVMDQSTINGTTFTLKNGTVSLPGTITYTGLTASFKPTDNLIAGITYTATITTGAKNSAGTPTTENYIWTFSTGAVIAPTVISTDPVDNATNVSLNKTINATFSVAMNPTSIKGSTFTLFNGTTQVSGNVTYSGTTAIFTPTNLLAAGTTYTATISTGVTNTSGTTMAENYIWTFSTGTLIAPTVISTDPIDGATNVNLNKTISATFSVVMDPTTIDRSTFMLHRGITPIEGTVTYIGLTAYFTPNENLISGAIYTATITTGVKDIAGTTMAENYVWTFTTETRISPTVISTDPTNNAINVSLNKIITAVFSVPMDPTTINGSTFTIFDGATPVSGNVTYSGTTATFAPTNNLTAGTTYTATITSGVNNTDGTPMAENYIWTFSTGAVLAPTVISTDPANNATNVSIDKTVTATFSVAMDPTTINTTSFTLYRGTTQVAGIVTYSGTTASFNPTVDLVSGAIYTATISNAAKNVAGISMVNNYVWTFTTAIATPPTVISTDPASNATNVALDKTVTATFSVAMDPTTINTTTFTLYRGTTQVVGIVTYSGTTASFNPTADMVSGAIYTATISNEVKNVAGTSMVNNYVWTFTTAIATPPTVISTDPASNATNVALGKTVTATFSVAMDPTTINSTTFTLYRGTTQVVGIVTYSGTTASFNPTADLVSGAIYTATISNAVKNVAGTSMVNNYVWTFTTAIATPPTVISTDPASNATNVALGKTVTATFSVAMDPTTINSTTFTLYRGTTQVTGIVTYSGTTASFNPTADLVSGAIYTATISNEVKNVAGTSMVNNYVWTFTTAIATPPTVISTDPASNATNVALGKTVTATFSVAMDPTTINSTTFTLYRGTTQVVGIVTYSGTTASFNPTADLVSGAIYTATISNAVKNVAGTSMVNNYVWTFTTEVVTPPTVVSTDPLNNETNVNLDKTVTATFSVPMDPNTINTVTFTLKHGSTFVNGNVTYSGSTASFNPSANLLSGTTYTATITTGAKNMAGVSMTNNYVWSFTTKDPAGPPVVELNSVARFGIIAGVGISNNAGFSQIRNMDVGISPGVRSSVTGFPPATIVNGDIYASDDVAPPGIAATLSEAKQDLTNAYLFAEGASTPAPVTVSGDIGGTTLTPGIYKTNSTLLIQSGDLTLDAQGDVNAVWIFQIASGFTTIGGAGGNVILSGGAQAKNIFWQTGSSATVGDFTSFQGNILALTSITMNSGATATGRMLCINGAVVMTNTNFINKP